MNRVTRAVSARNGGARHDAALVQYAHDNCTSSLIEYVNQVEPGAIPRHYSSVLTGRADEHLKRLGYLDPDYARRITRDWLAVNAIR